MRRMNRGLVASLENEEVIAEIQEVAEKNEAEQAAVAEAPVGDNAESLETDLIEVSEEQADADVAEAEIEQAVETAETLDEVAVALEACRAEGGLDRNAAYAISVALEGLYKTVGIDTNTRAMPALESFGQTSSRMEATRIAMEEVQEKAKQVWEAILAAIEKSIQWIKDRYTLIFQSAEKLGKRADELQKKAEATKGAPANKTVENERLAKALHLEGKIHSAEGAKRLAEIAKQVYAIAGDAIKAGEAIAGAAETGTLKDLNTTAYGNVDGFLPVLANPEGEGFPAVAENMELRRSRELPGGAAILLTVGKEGLQGEALIKTLAASKTEMGKFKPSAKDVESKEVEVLDTKNAVEVAKQVAELAKSVAAYRAELDKLESAKKRILESAKKAQKAAGSQEGEEKTQTSQIAGVLKAAVNILDQPAERFTVYALNTGKALLDHVEVSLKAFAGETAEAPKGLPAPAAAAAA